MIDSFDVYSSVLISSFVIGGFCAIRANMDNTLSDKEIGNCNIICLICLIICTLSLIYGAIVY